MTNATLSSLASSDSRKRAPRRPLAIGLEVAGALALVTCLAGGCGGSGAQAQSPEQHAAVERANVEQRLQGSWRLVDFRPDVTLEPFLQMWLDQQKNQLVVSFQNGVVTAQSPTLRYSQPYTLTQVFASRFTFTSEGNSGVPYASKCELSQDGRKIVFHAETQPMRGNGVLERIN